jgi:hypothetical protein
MRKSGCSLFQPYIFHSVPCQAIKMNLSGLQHETVQGDYKQLCTQIVFGMVNLKATRNQTFFKLVSQKITFIILIMLQDKR